MFSHSLGDVCSGIVAGGTTFCTACSQKGHCLKMGDEWEAEHAWEFQA